MWGNDYALLRMEAALPASSGHKPCLSFKRTWQETQVISGKQMYYDVLWCVMMMYYDVLWCAMMMCHDDGDDDDEMMMMVMMMMVMVMVMMIMIISILLIIDDYFFNVLRCFGDDRIAYNSIEQQLFTPYIAFLKQSETCYRCIQCFLHIYNIIQCYVIIYILHV